MTRDKKNYYQLTWRQIRAKINTFKNVPEQYAEYLIKKGEIVLDDPTPLEETKKQRAVENFQKYCVSKKPKKVSTIGKGWEEESIEPSARESLSQFTSDSKQKNQSYPTSDKKLKLSLDEDSEDEKGVKKSLKKQEKETLNEASNGVLQIKSNNSMNKIQNSDANSFTESEKVSHEKRKIEGNEKTNKRAKQLEKLPSSDSESEEELEGDEGNSEFVNLSDLSSEELSEDDILDDGEFVTDSEDGSD